MSVALIKGLRTLCCHGKNHWSEKQRSYSDQNGSSDFQSIIKECHALLLLVGK